MEGEEQVYAKVDKPVFSSPATSACGIVFDCVDGNVYKFNWNLEMVCFYQSK